MLEVEDQHIRYRRLRDAGITLLVVEQRTQRARF